jgi:hypothetical protein
MTRWFHAAAATLLVIAVWAGLGGNPAGPAADPRSQLVGLLARTGLEYEGDRPLLGGGSVLRFRLAACPSELAVIYFPSLSRITSTDLATIDQAGAKVSFIHDGEVVGGLGPLDLAPRWLWRKLLAEVRLRPSEPWQDIALALLVPRGCRAPPIDWRSLALAR